MGIFKPTILNKNFFFSSNDLYINFEKWSKKKGCNILFITGLSGSGKSTLAENLEKRYHAKMFELDGLEWNYDSSNVELLNKVKKAYPKYNEIFGNNKKKIDINHKEYFNIMKKTIETLISIMKKDTNNLYILEGIQIYQFFNPNQLKHYPLIIKNTSAIKSALQRFKRNGGGKINWIDELKNDFPGLIKWYYRDENKLNNFRKSIKEETVVYKKRNGVFSKENFNIKTGKANMGVFMVKEYDNPWYIRSDMINLNHSDNPNCKPVLLDIHGDKSTLIIGLNSIKDIKKDDEITIDYNLLPKNALDCVLNEHAMIFTEAGRKISTTKYKCPFCDYHATKEKLVTHIEKVHSDMIPKGFTGARVLFNAFNHKDHGNCIICGRETKWNESTWRYERLCGRKSCHDKYVKQMQDNMLKKYGKKNLLGDPEHQKKMLSNRSISGRYLFKDGHYKEYVGSYEKKLLEFLDKVLEVNSQDIYSPGPVIDYEYNGEKHKYISDFFYDPFNLIIEVKDGGNNPNTRDMKSYREKQLAKENAIKKLNKYNYIRLTNNDFQQLIATMLKIKEQLSENPNTSETIIDINEVGVAGAPIAGAMPRGNTPEAYIVPCFMNNAYSGSIISTDKFLKNIYRVQDDEIKKDNIDYLYNYDYDVYKIVKNNDKISDIINAKGKIKNKKDFLYSAITGKDLLDPKQFEYEECFEKVEEPYLDKWNKIVNISESIRYQFNILNNHNFDMNIINEQVLSKKKEKLSNYKKVDIKQDINGYFLCNTVTNCRTKSYKDIESIPESQYNNIENMKL